MLPSDAAMNQDTKSTSASHASNAGDPLTTAALLTLLAAGTVLRFLFLARKPFWFDECFSVEAARLDWANFLHLLWWREANMSLYYVLLRGWLHVGQSEFFIRSLSVIAAVAALPAIYWLAGLLFDRRTALIATALLAFNAYHIRYAQEARSYALFVLLATLSGAFFVEFLRESSRRNLLAYALTSVLAVYAHFYALLLVAAQWLALLLLSRSSPSTEDAQHALSVPPHVRRAWIWIAVSVLPLLVFVGKLGAGPLKWIHRPGFHDLLDYYEHMAGNAGAEGVGLYAIAVIAAVAPLGRKLFARRASASWEMWRYQFLLIWLLFPVLLTLVLSLARPVFYGRYLIFCLPAFLILAAAGVARLRGIWQLPAALAAMLLLSLYGMLSYYDHDFDLDRDGIGAASAYVMDHAQPADGVLFHIAATRVPYEFYRSLRARGSSADALGPEILFPHHADHLDYRDFTGKPTSEFLHSAPAQSRRVWVVLMYNGPPAEPDATTGILTQTLGEAFPKMQRFLFPQVEVRLYSRQ
ncbi:MAG: glycosyltransferase family 39 protein [Acidobacteriia bacterium]|nr:glycosyltransferase family 39 protein [Terriglobia bacterium]